MKKIFTKISLLCIGLMLCAGNAWGQSILNYEYSENEPYIAIVEANQSAIWLTVDLEIPENIEYNNHTYTVTTIAANAFPSTIVGPSIIPVGDKKVILPSSITTIGAGAFTHNLQMGTLTYVLNATTPPVLGENAFPEGSSIQVPSESLSLYQEDDSYTGYNLSDIASEDYTCGDGLTWSVRDLSAYSAGVCLYIAYDGEGTGVMTDFSPISPWYAQASTFTSISIAEGVTHIGNYAFLNCANVTAVGVPSTVTSIGNAAFAGCTSIASMTIPSSVTSIGEYAFEAMSITPTIAVGDITIDDGEGAAGVIALLNDSRNITINRPAQKEYYNTICLPFALDADQIEESSLANAEIYKFSNAEKDDEFLNLHFQPVSAMEAGVPYFFRFPTSDDNLSSLTFAGVTVTTTTPQDVTHNGVTLHGTLSQVTFSGSDKLYLTAGNNLMYYNGDKTINPFRAYFEVADGMSHAPKARIVAHENATTGVEDVAAESKAVKFVENGQILIKRGEAVYNLQGQVVK